MSCRSACAHITANAQCCAVVTNGLVVVSPASSWAKPTSFGWLAEGLFGLRFFYVALKLAAALGEFLIAGLGQEGIKAPAPFHGFQRMRADAQAYLALQCVADQRHIDQVRSKGALRLILRMAAQLAGHGPFARQLASPRHHT